MLMVKTYTAPSPIHGTGLFCAEPISVGTVVWRFDLGVDFLMHTKPEHPRDHPMLLRDGLWIVWGDDARYINHSSSPNIGGVTGNVFSDCVALRDISAGTEITEDYTSFDPGACHRDYVENDLHARLAAAESRAEEAERKLSDLNTKAAVLLYYSIDDLVDSYSTHLAVCKNAKEQYIALTSELAAAKKKNERLKEIIRSAQPYVCSDMECAGGSTAHHKALCIMMTEATAPLPAKEQGADYTKCRWQHIGGKECGEPEPCPHHNVPYQGQ